MDTRVRRKKKGLQGIFVEKMGENSPNTIKGIYLCFN